MALRPIGLESAGSQPSPDDCDFDTSDFVPIPNQRRVKHNKLVLEQHHLRVFARQNILVFARHNELVVAREYR
jgi:hypothetical protein